MKRLEILAEMAKSLCDNSDPSHDINHIHRVMQNCRALSARITADKDITKRGNTSTRNTNASNTNAGNTNASNANASNGTSTAEPSSTAQSLSMTQPSSVVDFGSKLNFNLEHLLAAALLHDLVNLPKNHPERKQASQMAAEKSRLALFQVGFAADEVEKITSIIREHSYSAGMAPSSLESAILQDADKLDALGAIGIMRTVTFGAKMGASYYHATQAFSNDRNLDDKAFMVDHFSTKLLNLPNLMNTSPAKAEGIRRVEFKKNFLAELRVELDFE